MLLMVVVSHVEMLPIATFVFLPYHRGRVYSWCNGGAESYLLHHQNPINSSSVFIKTCLL